MMLLGMQQPCASVVVLQAFQGNTINLHLGQGQFQQALPLSLLVSVWLCRDQVYTSGLLLFLVSSSFDRSRDPAISCSRQQDRMCVCVCVWKINC